MSSIPELDQVAAARRRLAAHAQFPTTYWVIYGIVLVALAGIPIWVSYVHGADTTWVSWVILALTLASVAYSRIRRRRSGVYLASEITAYPTAFKLWLVGLAATVVCFVGLSVLVHHGHRPLALGLLVPFAAIVLIAQIATRSAMRADIEAGRVSP